MKREGQRPPAVPAELDAPMEAADCEPWEYWAMRWLPWSAPATFLYTLVLVAVISRKLSGGSPCGMPLCDMSVYAGWPKYGLQSRVWSGGMIVLVLQLLAMCWCRRSLTGRGASMPAFAAAGALILGMAHIPFWQSTLHLDCTCGALVFLGIGGLVDARTDVRASLCVRCLRVALVVVMYGAFGAWYTTEREGRDLPILEYIALLCAVAYPLTWLPSLDAPLREGFLPLNQPARE